MTERYMKMTVIIEDGDEIITTVVHRAENLMTNVRHRDVQTTMFRDGTYPPRLGKTDFNINGVAVFSPEHGNYLETKRESKTELATSPLQAVLNLHNAHGKRWTGFPRADRQVSYCTECNKEAPCPTIIAARGVV